MKKNSGLREISLPMTKDVKGCGSCFAYKRIIPGCHVCGGDGFIYEPLEELTLKEENENDTKKP